MNKIEKILSLYEYFCNLIFYLHQTKLHKVHTFFHQFMWTFFDVDVECMRSMFGSGDDGDHVCVDPISSSEHQSIWSSRNFSFPWLNCQTN